MLENNEPSEKDVQQARRGLLDIIIGKLLSRKLMVFVTATYLMSLGKLSSSDWTMVAALYIGMQGAIDWYKVSKGINTRSHKDF